MRLYSAQERALHHLHEALHDLHMSGERRDAWPVVSAAIHQLEGPATAVCGLNAEFLADLAEKLREIATGTEELTRQHVNFNGEIRRKATVVQVAANMLNVIAKATGGAA